MAESESAQTAAGPSPRTEPASSTRKRFDARRVYTAVILIPAIYAVIRYSPAWAFTVLIIAGGTIALFELYRMAFAGRKNAVLVGLGIASAALMIAHPHLPFSVADLLLLGTLLMALTLLGGPASLEHRFRDMTVALFGVLYVGLTLSALVSTRALPTGEWLILFVAMVTWAGDTGAYYAGNLWGKHLLAPRVSPKKTMEGLLGGMALAVAMSLLARAWFLPQFSVMDALVLGALLTVAGLFGDLCESAMKRSVGVKDSGGILPGHGGMLDRLDSLLFTAPVFYYYIALVRGATPLP